MEKTTLALIAALGLTVAGAGVIAFGGEPAGRPSPVVEANATFNESAETLEIQLTQAVYAVEGETVPLETVAINHTTHDGGGAHAIAEPTVIQQGANISERGYWYQQGGGGVQQSPPRVGDTITIIRDKTDEDGDGRYGAESGQSYQLVFYFEGEYRAFDVLRIENGSFCGAKCQSE